MTDEQAGKILDAIFNIKVEGTSANPSGYGAPYKAPWYIIDATHAEPEVNYPGELIEQVDEAGQVSKALRRARIAAIVSTVSTC